MDKYIVDIISNPMPVWDRIITRMSDDFSDSYDPKGDYFGVFKGGKLVGAFILNAWNFICYEAHGGIDPDSYGEGLEICRAFGVSVFEDTPALKLVCIVPSYNRLMCKCLEKCGLNQEGTIKKSFLKWGRLHDQILYGVTKSEARRIIWQQEQA